MTEVEKISKTQDAKPDLIALCKQYGIKRVDLEAIHILDTSLATELSEDICRRHQVVPIELSDKGVLRLAMADPFDMVAYQVVASRTGNPIEQVWATPDDIDFALGQIFSDQVNFEQTIQELIEIEDDVEETEEDIQSVDLLLTQASDAPAVVFVNSLLVQAIQERASDIHIEPQENDLRIRLRIDGLLREYPPANKRHQQGVTARLKILADLDIAERRIPQDGRVRFKIIGRSVDVRVSTLPGIYGEKVVLRILDKGSTSLNIDDLGINPSLIQRFKDVTKRSFGMVLVTGPTGSGKTTTLYSVLNFINTPTLNIVTVEDPVEYRLAGINQIQAKPEVGLTFAKTLRSILRQDPDIVMVGEMRDHETAEIAIRASLTGHLVLSTLHTNHAISTITRLLNMDIDKYLIASSIAVVMSQRLVRRICLACKRPAELSEEIVTNYERQGVDISDLKTFIGTGCPQCSNQGYWGRLALHEVLFITNRLKEMIVQEKSEYEIKEVAEEEGMLSLLQDGLDKVDQGLTTIDEVIRVI